jgi:hypothetical protein
MVMLVGVMVAVAMHLVLVADVVMRALGGRRRGAKSESQHKKDGGEQGPRHGLFPSEPMFERRASAKADVLAVHS